MSAQSGPIAGLGHVNMRAPAAMIDALRRFYCEVLGLVDGPRPRFRSRGHWLYAGACDLVHLTVEDGAADAPAQRTGWLDHIAFAAVDLAATRARLDAAGVDYVLDAVPGREAQLFLRDPAGIGVELNFAADFAANLGIDA